MTGLGGPLLGLQEVMTFTATIERDQSTRDQLGAKGRRDWQQSASIQCFLWWGTGAAITRAGSVQQAPERTVDLDVGGMVMPAGTDVTARDRITNVVDQAGNTIAEKLEVLAVASFEPVTEISIRRIS